MKRSGSGSSIVLLCVVLAIVVIMVVASCVNKNASNVEPRSSSVAIQAKREDAAKYEQRRKEVYQHDLADRSETAKPCTLVTLQDDEVRCDVFYAEGHPDGWGYQRLEYAYKETRLDLKKGDFVALVGSGADEMCEKPDTHNHIVFGRVKGTGVDPDRRCRFVEADITTGSQYAGEPFEALKDYVQGIKLTNRRIAALREVKDANKELVKKVPEVFQPGRRVDVRLKGETWRVGLDGVVEAKSIWKLSETLSGRYPVNWT